MIFYVGSFVAFLCPYIFCFMSICMLTLVSMTILLLYISSYYFFIIFVKFSTMQKYEFMFINVLTNVSATFLNVSCGFFNVSNI